MVHADDTSFFNTQTNFETLTALKNNSMQNTEYWFLNDELVLNKAKIQCSNFSLRHVVHTYDNVNLLGFCIDPKLLWNDHITGICNKL